MNPIYDELVVKYYLSKGVVPFSYPHAAIVVDVGRRLAARENVPVVIARQRQNRFNLKG